MKDDYADIINLPHPVSGRHPRMAAADRAAQFAPFAALTGFGAVITESARLTDCKLELDDSQKEELNGQLAEIQRRISSHPAVTVTFFQPDEKKAGGAYVTVCGTVKKIDEYERAVVMTDGVRIRMDDLAAITPV